MRTRERLETKVARRTEWAAKAQTRSQKAFQQAHEIADNIPFGQPILVSHHSERHARADQRRIETNMDKGCEEHALAHHHLSKAKGLAHQLEHNIYSDDADAIEALEARIAEREAQAAKWMALNKAWRTSKGNPARFAELAGISFIAAENVADRIAQAYSWEKQPIAPYQLSNLRTNINRDRERIEEIKTRQTRSARAEAAGGVTIEGDAWVRVTFAEKPARNVLDALKTAGFRWGAGSWVGERAKLPACVEV